MDFPEADWKILRRVHAAGLERFCERVLGECHAMLQDSSGSSVERYLALYRHLKGRDRSIARAFDDMRRSRAMDRLVEMMALEIVTPDELAQFSRATRETAEALLALRTDQE